MENTRIYTVDKYWRQIFTDLGMIVVDSPNIADVVFDDIDVKKPISIMNLQNIILNQLDNADIVREVFGSDVALSNLQHKLIVMLYKKPDITMRELKTALGLSPDITTHSVETAIYQLRKKYGHNVILNTNGKYKIGQL
jgi:hypothetical protein